MTTYLELLLSPDPAVGHRAAREWCAWEDAPQPSASGSQRFGPPEHGPAFARLVGHCWEHGRGCRRGIVLEEAWKSWGIPA